MVAINTSNRLPVGIRLQFLCSVSCVTVRVFVMSSLQLMSMLQKHITLGLANIHQKAHCQMRTASAITASSRTLHIRLPPRPEPAGKMTYSSLEATYMPLTQRPYSSVLRHSNGRCSERIREEDISRSILCMTLRLQFRHSFISQRPKYTTWKLWMNPLRGKLFLHLWPSLQWLQTTPQHRERRSILRGKKNNYFRPMKWTRRFPPWSGILSDTIGYMDGQFTREKYPDKIRRVKYWDDENKQMFVFFTNTLDISPMIVTELYHQGSQIKLFFKWLKQHLKIKEFWGNSENAVRIQIYSAIISYCMMAIVLKKVRTERSIYETLQIVSISLTNTTTLEDLFRKPNYNIVNKLDGYSEPTLFDC